MAGTGGAAGWRNVPGKGARWWNGAGFKMMDPAGSLPPQAMLQQGGGQAVAPAQQPQVAAAQQRSVPTSLVAPASQAPTAAPAPAAGQYSAQLVDVSSLSPQEQDVWRQMGSPGNPIRRVQKVAAMGAGGPNTEGLEADPRFQPDLATRRRAAFLNASDSMSGLKAVRSLLADEARAQGADISAGGAIPSIRFLENEIAKRQPMVRDISIAEASENDRQVFQQMQFPDNPITRVSEVTVPAWGQPSTPAGPVPIGQLPAGDRAVFRQMQFPGQPITQVMRGGTAGAPVNQPAATPLPSGAGRAVIDAYMRDELANKVRQSTPPLSEVAPWQTASVNYAAPRTDPGRDGMLAAFAAKGEKPPSTPGEAFGRLAAAAPLGGRGGQFKEGNSFRLGHVDPRLLRPMGSSGLRISGSAYLENPGNFYG